MATICAEAQTMRIVDAAQYAIRLGVRVQGRRILVQQQQDLAVSDIRSRGICWIASSHTSSSARVTATDPGAFKRVVPFEGHLVIGALRGSARPALPAAA
jgi:hypothetical protein